MKEGVMSKIINKLAILALPTALGAGILMANIESNSDCNTYCTTDPNYDCIILYGSGVEGITCFDMRKR